MTRAFFSLQEESPNAAMEELPRSPPVLETTHEVKFFFGVGPTFIDLGLAVGLELFGWEATAHTQPY
jgi:hypothetical protein